VSALAGLEHYTPAPAALEPPAWVVRGEQVWARLNEECRPVAIVEGGTSWTLEVDTCVEDERRCWVTVRSAGSHATANSWCGTEASMGGPVDGDGLRLVTADEDHVAYTRIVGLTVVPVGLRGEFHQCTARSLRELERRGDFTAEVPTDPMEALLEHRLVWMDQRACSSMFGACLK
jgi:hypothetical protein